MPHNKRNRKSRQITSHSNRAMLTKKFNPSMKTDAGAPFGFVIAFILILSIALTVVVGRVTNASGGPHPSTTVVRNYKGFCGNPEQPTCPLPDPRWFSITSDSPSAIAEAIVNCKDFAMLKARYGNALVDTPVLVHSFGPRTNIQWYDNDHWVVSTRNASGKEVGILDFVYDHSHHRLRFSSFAVLGQQDPNIYQTFPYISLTTAAAQLMNQRKLNLQIGTQPELIFFPIDPRWRELSSPVHLWSGGGDAPMDPMWIIVGSDKHEYFVGTDLKVYTKEELPFAPDGQP
jgi:hypothetical protein